MIVLFAVKDYKWIMVEKSFEYLITHKELESLNLSKITLIMPNFITIFTKNLNYLIH